MQINCAYYNASNNACICSHNERTAAKCNSCPVAGGNDTQVNDSNTPLPDGLYATQTDIELSQMMQSEHPQESRVYDEELCRSCSIVNDLIVLQMVCNTPDVEAYIRQLRQKISLLEDERDKLAQQLRQLSSFKNAQGKRQKSSKVARLERDIDSVRQLKALKISNKVIAEKFGVSEATVRRLLKDNAE